jgi:hypothetical protein
MIIQKEENDKVEYGTVTIPYDIVRTPNSEIDSALTEIRLTSISNLLCYMKTGEYINFVHMRV